MSTQESYSSVVQDAIAETADRFHLTAETEEGQQVRIPFTYQILEPGFRPHRAGKASPEEVQEQLDQLVMGAAENGVTLGIESAGSLAKLALQNGWGADCSNFAGSTLVAVHSALGLPDYHSQVFRSAEEIRKLHEESVESQTDRWLAKDEERNPRELTDEERDFLEAANMLPVSWIANIFGKDSSFITGSAHICAPEATEEIALRDILPGDLVAFSKAGSGIVSHVAIVEQAETDGDTPWASFWHSWHTRDFGSGVRRDEVILGPDGFPIWSHEGLGDPERYQGYRFLRPVAMVAAHSELQFSQDEQVANA